MPTTGMPTKRWQYLHQDYWLAESECHLDGGIVTITYVIDLPFLPPGDVPAGWQERKKTFLDSY